MAYTKNNLIYLAGIMDADGWFSVQRTQKSSRKYAKSATYTPIIGVANVDIRLMNWLVENFGGNVRKRVPHKDQLGDRVRYEWHPHNVKSMEEVVSKIIPFLIVKKRRAEILMEIRKLSSNSYRGKGVPKEVSEKREKLYLELRKLNHTKHKVVLV